MLSRGGPGCLGVAMLGMVAMGLPRAAVAQRVGAQPVAAVTVSGGESSTVGQNPAPFQTGTISGTVIDTDGDAIVGAHVTLTNGGSTRKMVADGDGYFSFLDLPANAFQLSVAADGFKTSVKPVALRAGEDVETPDVVLAVAGENVDVEVSLSHHDLAEEDMHLEEKQRLIGFIPNFYVVYDWNAPSLSPGQKFKLAWRAAIDPANFLLSGLIAGGEQAGNAFSGYHQGALGYGKRLGASLADGTVGDFLGGAVFPVLLHQDPRYFYMGTGSIVHRALYAMASAIICRGDNGRWQPNYSSVLGDVASGAISNTYYPASNRSGALLTVENGLLNAAEDGFGNLLQEFVFKRISTGIPKSVPAAIP